MYWTRKLDGQWRARLSVANALGRSLRAGTFYRAPDGTRVTRMQTWDGMASLRLGLERTL